MIDHMAQIRLRYLHRETTRHGRTVYYVRVNDGPRTRLRGEPGSEEFMAAYHAAIRGDTPEPPKERSCPPGTLGWLIDQYKGSARFALLGASTRGARENIMARLKQESGHVHLSQIDRSSVERGRDKRAAKPEAANSFVKVMRAVYGWGVMAHPDRVKADISIGVKLLKGNPDGFHTWTVEEVEIYRRHHKPGTKARLAMDLLLFTGLRRSDIVSFGRQHIRNGVMEIRPYKTRDTSAVTVTLPVMPALLQAVAAGPCGDLTFIVSERGTPFTPESFTNWFRDQCRDAKVPGSAHGLRKAAASIAAENGANELQLMAMFGWTTSKQAGRYTRAASRRKLALDGSAFMPGGERDENTFPRTLKPGAAESGKRSTKSKVENGNGA